MKLKIVLAAALALVVVGCASQKSETKKGRDVSSLISYTGDAIKINEAIKFDTGSADIDHESHDLLEAIAVIIKSTGDIAKVTIEGHTDSTGDADFNKSLSQQRADSVKNYLVSKGVPAEKLEAVGFGQENPVDSNETDEGRQHNRRVEFKVTH